MNIVTITGGSLYTNCYMAWGENSDTCILVDPGFDAEQILDHVRSHGKQVDAVLLTHGHFDHVGGAKVIAQETGCKVYIHKADLELPNKLTLGTIPCTDHYDEGEILNLAGLTLRVIHTPGHTPGGVCLVSEDVIFSGDTLFAGTCGRTDLPGGSFAQISQSLTRLSDLEGNYQVFPGHGEATNMDLERRCNPYMQGSLWN